MDGDRDLGRTEAIVLLERDCRPRFATAVADCSARKAAFAVVEKDDRIMVVLVLAVHQYFVGSIEIKIKPSRNDLEKRYGDQAVWSSVLTTTLFMTPQ